MLMVFAAGSPMPAAAYELEVAGTGLEGGPAAFAGIAAAAGGVALGDTLGNAAAGRGLGPVSLG